MTEMATAKESGTKKSRGARGRTVPSAIPKMVSHLLVAERIGVPAGTLRKWVGSKPPLFPRPAFMAGQLWFYREDAIIDLLSSGAWTQPEG